MQNFSLKTTLRQFQMIFTNAQLKLHKLHIALKLLNYTHILPPKLSRNMNELREHIQKMILKSSLIAPNALPQYANFLAY